jgi:acyl-coenzyme A thioesterase PaaI-like protein
VADLHDPSPYHERYQQLVGAELSPRRAEMHRLADAIRVAIDCLIHTRASDSDIAGAADLAEALATMLRAQPRGRSVDGWAEVANAGDAFGFFDYSPVFGRANPLAPPVEMEVHDSEVRGRARWGAAYEGPPGCVHGGHIAAAFDEVLGMTQSIAGAPGMTGILTIRYRNPTPLHTDLTFVARVARVDGRKIYTEGTLLNDDVVCAEGEALFISVDFGKFEAMRAQANEAQVNDDTRSSTSSP